jgi:hypothetical protein
MSELTYVYCLVRVAAPPEPGEAPDGPAGAGPLRALAAGEGRWLMVATVPRSGYDEEAVAAGLDDLSWVSARALAHERMIEHVAARSGAESLLPMKLLTLFTSDERARSWAASDGERLEGLLDRVAGRVEVGLRITRAAAAPPAPGPRPATGTGFLLAKKAYREGELERAEEAATAAARCFDTLAAAAVDSRRRPAPAEATALLLDAVFLVAAEATGDFEGRIAEEARRLAEAGCEVTVTGPWPPYHFATEGP